jgi:Txe/YoeB family toxin of Txe-Axe toxin-antitoxin module
MIKPSKVKFICEELEKEFESLPENDPIKKGIRRAIEDLHQNAFSGTQIPKRLFPQDYIKKYNISNLWKYDLPNAWRLIYTITAENEVDLISAILNWFDHKDYEREFKY